MPGTTDPLALVAGLLLAAMFGGLMVLALVGKKP